MSEVLQNSDSTCVICMKPTKPGITMHSFPTDKVLKKIWLDLCGISVSEYQIHYKICSRHFTNECFMRRNGERHLYLGSIPTKYRKRKTSNNEHGKESKFGSSNMQPKSLTEYVNTDMMKFNTPFDKEFPAKWVCKLCHAFVLSKKGVKQHYMTCVPLLKTFELKDVYEEEYPVRKVSFIDVLESNVGWQEVPPPNKILKFIEIGQKHDFVEYS